MARIAVIGAGMGAMAASARLAVAGHEVTVYERDATHGGRVRRRERDGFAFDTGPGLLHLPAVYRDLFLKTGRSSLEQNVSLEQADPAARHVFADGTDVSLPNASRAGVVAALDGALGEGAGRRWADLLNRAREAWDATRRPLLEEPLEPDGPGGPPPSVARDPYPALRRKGLLRRRPPTLSEVAADELRDARLAALLESYALAWGLDPATAPASATVLPYLEHTFGTWYPAGGIRALADAVYRRCLERRVAFRFHSEVRHVLRHDGRAAGVETADGAHEADVVVAGCPLTGLLEAPADAPGTATARSRFAVLLALRGGREEEAPHRTVVHRADAPRQPMTLLRPGDPALVPDGHHESAVLSVTMSPGEAGALVPGEAERLAGRLLEAADAAVPGLAERVLWHEVLTPGDLGGPVPAPALAGGGGGFLHAPNRSPLPGLYRAGGWAHPGGGLAHAGMSGAMVAGLVVEGDGWRGSQ